MAPLINGTLNQLEDGNTRYNEKRTCCFFQVTSSNLIITLKVASFLNSNLESVKPTDPRMERSLLQVTIASILRDIASLKYINRLVTATSNSPVHVWLP